MSILRPTALHGRAIVIVNGRIGRRTEYEYAGHAPRRYPSKERGILGRWTASRRVSCPLIVLSYRIRKRLSNARLSLSPFLSLENKRDV